jgi:hypothetical protein
MGAPGLAFETWETTKFHAQRVGETRGRLTHRPYCPDRNERFDSSNCLSTI